MSTEKIWYEFRPYLFALSGIASLFYLPSSLLLKTSSSILMFGSLLIIGIRWKKRIRQSAEYYPPYDEKKYLALITQDLFYDVD